MPLHVEIKINEKTLNTIHIGRLSGNTHPDNINTYAAVEGITPETKPEWLKGVKFEHRYGDGAEICVIKAIEALKTSQSEHTEKK